MIQDYEPGDFTKADAKALHGQYVTISTYDGRDRKGMGEPAADYDWVTVAYQDGEDFLCFGTEAFDDEDRPYLDTSESPMIMLADIKTVEVHP